MNRFFVIFLTSTFSSILMAGPDRPCLSPAEAVHQKSLQQSYQAIRGMIAAQKRISISESAKQLNDYLNISQECGALEKNRCGQSRADNVISATAWCKKIYAQELSSLRGNFSGSSKDVQFAEEALQKAVDELKPVRQGQSSSIGNGRN